jgi:uncharacterized protein with GYD domain
MRRFSHQISFTSSAWPALFREAIDPFSPIRLPIEALGGKLISAFFTDDCYDVLALSEFPAAVSAADISIAFYAGGAVATIRSSSLLTASQAHESKRRSVALPPRDVPSSCVRATPAS